MADADTTLAADLAADLAAGQAAERERLATQLAYERGRENGVVTARLDAHDAHFLAINGSIERLAVTVASIDAELRKERGERITGEDVSRAVAAALDATSRKQLSARMFMLAVGTLSVTLLGVIAAIVSH